MLIAVSVTPSAPLAACWLIVGVLCSVAECLQLLGRPGRQLDRTDDSWYYFLWSWMPIRWGGGGGGGEVK